GVALGAAALVPAPLRAQGPGPSPVVVAPVVEEEVRATKTFVGSVAAVRSSLVSSEVQGQVAELLVREGDRVQEDQPLARLKTTTLEIQLAAASAAVDLRRQELAELENGSRPEEIEQARADVEAAAAETKYRQWQLKSIGDLYAKGSLTEEDLELARYNASRAVAAERRRRAVLKLVEKGPREERLAQARARQRTQQEEVRRLEEEVRLHTIRAPFSGHVVAEHTEVGEWLSEGDRVAEVVALDSVDVEIGVPEDSIGRIRVGMRAEVNVDARPDHPFTAAVARLVPKAEPRTRAFPVKIRVPNRFEGDDALLKAGMLARVRLGIGDPERALLVPKDALVLGGPSPVVFVVDPQAGTVRRVPVRLGVSAGERIQVRGEVVAGDRVVVRGNERLHPGARVRIAQR
ncbi:MAG: efflux RND transporter periplasmic adaptor subunit, partial [Planctomycetota bacterium]